MAGLTALLEREAADERVLVLSPGIYPIYPALNYAGVRSTLRTMDMWLLQGAYHVVPAGRPPLPRGMGDGAAGILRLSHRGGGFCRTPPAAVLVDIDPGIPWCGSQFDFIAYFKRHPLFAEVWSHYQLDRGVGPLPPLHA